MTRVKWRNAGNGAASALVILKPVECIISYDSLALVLQAQQLPCIYSHWIHDVGRSDPDNINRIVETATKLCSPGGWSNVLLQHSVLSWHVLSERAWPPFERSPSTAFCVWQPPKRWRFLLKKEVKTSLERSFCSQPVKFHVS